jgi:hypothetical protein
VKRRVRLELTEEYSNGGKFKDTVEVTNVDEEDRSTSAKTLTKIALAELGEKKDV